MRAVCAASGQTCTNGTTHRVPERSACHHPQLPRQERAVLFVRFVAAVKHARAGERSPDSSDRIPAHPAAERGAPCASGGRGGGCFGVRPEGCAEVGGKGRSSGHDHTSISQ